MRPVKLSRREKSHINVVEATRPAAVVGTAGCRGRPYTAAVRLATAGNRSPLLWSYSSSSSAAATKATASVLLLPRRLLFLFLRLKKRDKASSMRSATETSACASRARRAALL